MLDPLACVTWPLCTCDMTHAYMYGVATVSRIDKITYLFCRILSLLRGSFAKETYNFIDPTNQSHPIPCLTSYAAFPVNKCVAWLIYACRVTRHVTQWWLINESCNTLVQQMRCMTHLWVMVTCRVTRINERVVFPVHKCVTWLINIVSCITTRYPVVFVTKKHIYTKTHFPWILKQIGCNQYSNTHFQVQISKYMFANK